MGRLLVSLVILFSLGCGRSSHNGKVDHKYIIESNEIIIRDDLHNWHTEFTPARYYIIINDESIEINEKIYNDVKVGDRLEIKLN